MNALKILFVSEDVPHPMMGGLGKHAVTLAGALMEAGHAVDFMGNNLWPHEVVTGDPKCKGQFYPALNPRGAYWKEKQLGFYNYARRAYLARRYARAIMRIADRYDVIHYHGHLPILANYIPEQVNFVQTRHDQGSDCLALTRFKNGTVCHDTDPAACGFCASRSPNRIQQMLSSASVRRWRCQVRAAFERHKVIYVSKFLKDNLRRTLGNLNEASVRVIHNFVDILMLSEALAEQSKMVPVDICVAARLSRVKGVGEFLVAAKGLLETGRRVSVIGDGPELEALREQFSGDGVSFFGWKTYAEVVRFMAHSRIIVVPSIWEEPCATTILEGLALGRPVLALSRGGTPELSIYEQYSGQLKLAADMKTLVRMIDDFEAKTIPKGSVDLEFSGDVRQHLDELLSFYRA